MKISGTLSKVILGCVIAVGLQATAAAQIFLTEDFDYADGDLTTVSGGLWETHSGVAPDIQVVGGEAVVTAPGSMDDNRQLGVVMGPTDVWFYAVRFTVSEPTSGGGVNNDYFIHFHPDAGFGFRARLATVAPADPANGDFSLQIWASSGGDGMTDWDGDFAYGEEITAVVRWENETGVATLWVNPTDINSTSIADDELRDAMETISAIALRQDSTDGSIVNIPVLSVGTDFDAVLAEVAAGPPTGGGFVPPTAANVFRGVLLSGALADYQDSDDALATFNPGFVLNDTEAPVWLIFDAVAAGATSFRVESTAGTPGLTYTVEAFNWAAGSFEEIGSLGESFNSETVETFNIVAADHIDVGGEVRGRVGWRQTGFTLNFPWDVRVDQTGWNQ